MTTVAARKPAGPACYNHGLRLAVLSILVVSLAAAAQSPVFDPARAAQTAPLAPALRAQLDEALRKRDFTRAETILVGEIGRNPKSPELLTLAAGIFFLDRQYLNSVVALKKAEKLAPLDEANRFTLAMGYILINRVAWARPELERLAREIPRNPLYPYWLARLDYDERKYAAAIAKLHAAIEMDPAFVKAYDRLGLCLDMMGEPDEALAAYKKAVELNRLKPPAWAWPPLNLGTLLIRLGRLEDAEPLLRESLRYDANLAQAHYQLGILLEKRNRPLEALEELRKAGALDSSYPEPQYALGRIYRNLGRTAEADQAFSAFRKLKSRERPENWQE